MRCAAFGENECFNMLCDMLIIYTALAAHLRLHTFERCCLVWCLYACTYMSHMLLFIAYSITNLRYIACVRLTKRKSLQTKDDWEREYMNKTKKDTTTTTTTKMKRAKENEYLILYINENILVDLARSFISLDYAGFI